MNVEEIAERLGGKGAGPKSWKARCPAHDDRNPSLSISEADNGGTVMHCHAGCTIAEVLEAAGMTTIDLASPTFTSNGHDDITYGYTDETGEVLFEVVRKPGKKFLQRRPDGAGGWIWKRADRLVLYRLPHVIKAVANGDRVIICEGEKDADRVTAEGECGTTAPMGAGKWSKVAEHACRVLLGAQVIVVRDNDEAGRRHAAEVVASLRGVAVDLALAEPAVGKDVSDHLAAGLTIDELLDVTDSGDVLLETASSTTPDDDGAHLPDKFWNARPVLGHIRQAAHSRARSADAYLGAILARVAALTHPSIQLPPIVAAAAPLTLYVAQVGRSGLGKSSTVSGASELLPYDGTDVADNMPLGSGEGLIELFCDLVDEVGPDGKTRKVKRQTRHGAFIYLDEGAALAELGNRKGSTLLPMLRTAWSGQVLGTSNASAETKRRLAAGSYSIGLVIAFQPTKAAELLADTSAGTPQRFEWMQGTDPTLPDSLPPWPGPLHWKHPTLRGYGSSITPTLIGVPDTIADPIRRRAIELTRGEIEPDELDSHATLARLKVAGLLAVLDGRTNINDQDWELAGIFQRVSHHVRAVVLAAVAIEQRKIDEAHTARHVAREGAVIDDQVGRAIERMAKAIGRHVHREQCEDGCKQRCVSRATAGTDRALAVITDAVDRAIELKWIRVDGDAFLPGEARPT